MQYPPPRFKTKCVHFSSYTPSKNGGVNTFNALSLVFQTVSVNFKSKRGVHLEKKKVRCDALKCMKK